MNNSNEETIYEQFISVYLNNLMFIPELQSFRDNNCKNSAIEKSINANILLLSFSTLEGYLSDFVNQSINYYEYTKPGTTPLERKFLEKYKRDKRNWMFDDKIETISILSGEDIKKSSKWNKIITLRDFRNIIGHGGNIAIKLQSLSDEIIYKFEREVCINMLKQTGYIKSNDSGNISKDKLGEYLNEVTSTRTSNFYFEIVKEFIKEIQNIHPNPNNKNIKIIK